MQSLPHQQETVAAANRLIDQANKLASPVIRFRLTTGLEFATRLTASNASQLAAMSEEATRHTRTSQYKVGSRPLISRAIFTDSECDSSTKIISNAL